MNTSKSEKSIKELFIGKCWVYLNDNFHKFTETNKIKVALELCKKDVAVDLNIATPNIKIVWEADGKTTEITPQPVAGMDGQEQV